MIYLSAHKCPPWTETKAPSQLPATMVCSGLMSTLSGMDADDALAVAEHTDVRKLGRVKMLSSIQVRFVPFADIVDDSFS